MGDFKELFQFMAFVLVFFIGAVLPIVGALLFILFAGLGWIDIKL